MPPEYETASEMYSAIFHVISKSFGTQIDQHKYIRTKYNPNLTSITLGPPFVYICLQIVSLTPTGPVLLREPKAPQSEHH